MKQVSLALLLLILPIVAASGASQAPAPEGASPVPALSQAPSLCLASEAAEATPGAGLPILQKAVCECEVDADCSWKVCSPNYHPVCGTPQTCGRCICNHN